MSYIEEAKDLLKDKKTTFVKLLAKLCELEREYGELKHKIKVGLSTDGKTLLETASIANTIRATITQRVQSLVKTKLGNTGKE
jgi:hypothetical protein